MQTKLEIAAETLLSIAIEEVFFQLHKKFYTKSGDIAPDQEMLVDYYKNQLAKICVEVIKQNQ